MLRAIKARDITTALQTIRDVMKSGKPGDRLKAAAELLDRAVGKPIPLDLQVEVETLRAELEALANDFEASYRGTAGGLARAALPDCEAAGSPAESEVRSVVPEIAAGEAGPVAAEREPGGSAVVGGSPVDGREPITPVDGG
jgi:hypothetical protein